MFIVGLLGWWYGAGWRERLGMIRVRLLRVFDTFSLDLLLKTLFSPFRQIGTNTGGRGISAQFRAFLDQLVSRSIGAVVRLFTFIAGIICISVVALAGLIEAVLWFFIPLLPVVGAVLYAVGWVPHVSL